VGLVVDEKIIAIGSLSKVLMGLSFPLRKAGIALLSIIII